MSGSRRDELSPEELAKVRALGALSHLIANVRLGRDHGLDPAQLAMWSLQQYTERGYHDEWIAAHGMGNVDRFLHDFLNGRRVLYDDIAVTAANDCFIVESRIWYHDELPEPFFYFDVSPEEFTSYVVALGEENAKRAGIDLKIRHDNGVEHAAIRKPVKE